MNVTMKGDELWQGLVQDMVRNFNESHAAFLFALEKVPTVLIMHVHDELLIEVPEDKREEVTALIHKYLADWAREYESLHVQIPAEIESPERWRREAPPHHDEKGPGDPQDPGGG